MKKTVAFIAITASLVVFAGIYSLLSSHTFFNGEPLFNSPDETANYFFSKHYAQTGTLSFTESLLEQSKGFIHPRSMTARGDQIVPVGFLGLPILYGSLAHIVGINAIPFFTPILASVSAFFFYLLIAQFFSKKIAFISALLFLIHPAYLYNVERAMLPNVLFIDLLIIGASLAAVTIISTPRNMYTRITLALFAGTTLGTALWVRFSEVFWIAPLMLSVMVFMVYKRLFGCVSAFIIGLSAMIGIQSYFNGVVYGNPLLFGYQTALIPYAVSQIEQTRNFGTLILSGRFSDMFSYLQSLGSAMRALLFPFGISFENALRVSQNYLIVFFPLFSLLTAIGVVRLLRSRVHQWFYALVTIALSLWLVIFYGSWEFYDNLNRETTIGTSYVRYWLPIYLFTLPFAAETIFALFHYSKRVGRVLAIGVIAALVTLSFQQSIIAPAESVEAMMREVGEYAAKRELILKHTDTSALIVSARSDKIFFPVRRVAEHLEHFNELELIAPLTSTVPVYYYGFWSVEDAEYLSQTIFSRYGLTLEFIVQADERERLYRVVSSQ